MSVALHRSFRFLPLVLLAALAACTKPQQQAGGFHGFPPAAVTVKKVEPQTFPVSFEYVGQTQGSKDVEVRARVTGIIEKRLYQEGSFVKAGQPLFTIDARTYEAQVNAAKADLARAQAQKAQADRELARLKPLAERHAIGQKEADDAASNADFASAAVKSAQAKLAELNLNLGYTKVVAPISGLTSRAQKSEGSLATQNETLLTTISQINPIWIVFNVSENERLRLNRAASDGRLRLPKDNAYDVTVKLSDGSTFPTQGKINFADTRVNPTTGTYEMRAEIPNADGALKPGQFVRVILRGASRVDVLAVPQVAVLDGPQGKFVYVAGNKDGKDVAVPRPVVVGDWVGTDGTNEWVVESGLKPGDPVIVDGVARLMPGGPIKVGPDAAANAAAASPPASSKESAASAGTASKESAASSSSKPKS
ncbi:MAG TPA: efflux RND transporter periplasmic adaptor subunit [Casimicrobiaceae bacterium]|nr:efflux RND transporter periplasmic adaptor subunit [Casimicrobiaceae bacterium]